MPELPEVETMRRGITPVVGSCIVDVEFVKSRFKKIAISPRRDVFRRRTSGQRIQGRRATGKTSTDTPAERPHRRH